MFFDLCSIGFYAHYAMVVERPAGIGKQANGLKKIVNHHRFENIEFKITGASAHIDSGVDLSVAYAAYARRFKRYREPVVVSERLVALGFIPRNSDNDT